MADRHGRMADGMADQNGGMADGMVEWSSGGNGRMAGMAGMAEWQKEWQNGKMAEMDTYVLFMVHADTDDDDVDDTLIFYSIDKTIPYLRPMLTAYQNFYIFFLLSLKIGQILCFGNSRGFQPAKQNVFISCFIFYSD